MSKGLMRVFVYISYFAAVFGITLEPSPTSYCQRYNFLTVTCSVNENWSSVGFYYNSNGGNENVAFFINMDGTCPEFAKPLPGLYNTSCNYISNTFHLTIKNVTDSYHGRVVECIMQPGDLRNSTTINVQYAPITFPTITQMPSGPVNEGETVQLTCTITVGNPLATIAWQCPGFVDITPTDTPTTNESVSIITRAVSKNDNGRKCVCIGKHLLWEDEKEITHTLNVYFQPTSHISIIQTPPGPVNNSDRIILTCEIKGGFPLAMITWECNGSSVVTSPGSPKPDTSLSSVQLIVSKDTNGAVCKCEGSHPVWKENRMANVTLNVRFAPTSIPSIKQLPNGPVFEGNMVTLTCTIFGGNPLGNIVWQCPGFTIVTPNGTLPTNEHVASIERVVTRDDNGRVCECSGRHPLWATEKHKNHTLNVYYRPSITISPNYAQYKVIENTTNIEVNCTVVTANPVLSTYRWYKDGSLMNGFTAATYSIPLVKRSHTGSYTCDASNTVGISDLSSVVQLNVLYGIELNPISKKIQSEGNKLTITSTGQSYPLMTGSDVKWTKQNNNTFSRVGQQLVMDNVNIVDTGTYVCFVVLQLTPSVGQSVNVTGRTTVEVDIVFKPFLDHTRPYSPPYVSAAENNSLYLQLTINANPTPTIAWTFKAEADWNSCNFTTIVSNTTTNSFLTSSSILIDDIENNIFGEYVFAANNTVGTFFRRFVVMKEAYLTQVKCPITTQNTDMFVAGIVTLVVGLMSLTAAIIFVVRNGLKNNALNSSKSVEYSDIQRSNPAFTDAYTTLQSNLESTVPSEQTSNTYEECGRTPEAHTYSSIAKIESEPSQYQQHGVNTYEECGKRIEAHAYDTVEK